MQKFQLIPPHTLLTFRFPSHFHLWLQTRQGARVGFYIFLSWRHTCYAKWPASTVDGPTCRSDQSCDTSHIVNVNYRYAEDPPRTVGYSANNQRDWPECLDATAWGIEAQKPRVTPLHSRVVAGAGAMSPI